jgi:hypothetical protein
MIRKSASIPVFRLAAVVALGCVLAACGKVGNLEPRTGQSLPPKAYGQKEASSSEALTTPSVQARPGRGDELLRRSERRVDDPFDLAPGEEPVPLPDPDAENNPKPKAE